MAASQLFFLILSPHLLVISCLDVSKNMKNSISSYSSSNHRFSNGFPTQTQSRFFYISHTFLPLSPPRFFFFSLLTLISTQHTQFTHTSQALHSGWCGPSSSSSLHAARVYLWRLLSRGKGGFELAPVGLCCCCCCYFLYSV